MNERKKFFDGVKRIVVKIGSSSLTLPDGGLDILNMKKFVGEVSNLKKQGFEFIIVSSGAIAAGLKYLSIDRRPDDLSLLQASASVGQVELMRIYSELFSEFGIKVGQILLTHEDTTRREQYLNIKNTIEKLIKMNIIPIINENDSVAVDEIKFGDNDKLAALVSCLSEADVLVILSDIDGLFEKDPRLHPDARFISMVERVDENIERIAGGIGSTYGSGGMVTKVKAAKICSFSGIGMVIANSRDDKVLEKVIRGEDTGTFFVPQKAKRLKSKKSWIAFGKRSMGSITIDKGAEEAIVKKGKSILPVGVVKVSGNFAKGDTLKVFSLNNELIAKGISNFSREEINKLKGKNEKQIREEFGTSLCGEIIHRDSLVVFKE